MALLRLWVCTNHPKKLISADSDWVGPGGPRAPALPRRRGAVGLPPSLRAAGIQSICPNSVPSRPPTCSLTLKSRAALPELGSLARGRGARRRAPTHAVKSALSFARGGTGGRASGLRTAPCWPAGALEAPFPRPCWNSTGQQEAVRDLRGLRICGGVIPGQRDR